MLFKIRRAAGEPVKRIGKGRHTYDKGMLKEEEKRISTLMIGEANKLLSQSSLS